MKYGDDPVIINKPSPLFHRTPAGRAFGNLFSQGLATCLAEFHSEAFGLGLYSTHRAAHTCDQILSDERADLTRRKLFIIITYSNVRFMSSNAAVVVSSFKIGNKLSHVHKRNMKISEKNMPCPARAGQGISHC